MDVGGDFRSEKHYVRENRLQTDSPIYSFETKGPLYTHNEYGPLFAVQPRLDGNWNMSSSYESSDARLLALGSTAISRCKPTNSVASLSTALGELRRDGIPKLIGAHTWEEKALNLKSAGGEYLNVVFGWEPLIADVKDMAYAIRNSDKILKQYQRDAGRLVRRRYEFPMERSVGPINDYGSGWYPYFPEGYNLSQGAYDHYPFTAGEGRLTSQLIQERHQWFSGAFTYYIPSGTTAMGKLGELSAKAGKLLGLELSPEVFWELTPWSWAVDWFSNTGDIISNVSSFITDGLVLRYGYIMEHSVSREIYTLENVPLNGRPHTTFTLEKIHEVKKRKRATPFGFGVDEANLSGRQLSILAALGITRR